LVVAGPFPNAEPGRAVFDGGIHVQPLQLGLLAGDDDIIAAAQTVVGYGQQGIGVGGADKRG
jgi:hypothetical protein